MKNILTALLFLTVFASRLTAQTYDASVQFSTASNPNGVWRYGFEPSTLGLDFTLFNTNRPFTFMESSTPIDTWYSSAVPFLPGIYHNGTGTDFLFGAPHNILWETNEISLHPGSGGQFAVLRFVAPAADTYEVTASFRGIDFEAGGTDVHVLTNNVSIFDQQVTGYHAPVLFSTTLRLATSDTVDFAVGFGINGNYFNDSTGVYAVIVGTSWRLNINKLPGSKAVLTWPTNLTKYTLEYTTDLHTAGWSGVTNRVAATGEHFSVTVDIEGSQRFFRLRTP